MDVPCSPPARSAHARVSRQHEAEIRSAVADTAFLASTDERLAAILQDIGRDGMEAGLQRVIYSWKPNAPNVARLLVLACARYVQLGTALTERTILCWMEAMTPSSGARALSHRDLLREMTAADTLGRIRFGRVFRVAATWKTLVRCVPALYAGLPPPMRCRQDVATHALRSALTNNVYEEDYCPETNPSGLVYSDDHPELVAVLRNHALEAVIRALPFGCAPFDVVGVVAAELNRAQPCLLHCPCFHQDSRSPTPTPKATALSTKKGRRVLVKCGALPTPHSVRRDADYSAMRLAIDGHLRTLSSPWPAMEHAAASVQVGRYVQESDRMRWALQAAELFPYEAAEIAAIAGCPPSALLAGCRRGSCLAAIALFPADALALEDAAQAQRVGRNEYSPCHTRVRGPFAPLLDSTVRQIVQAQPSPATSLRALVREARGNANMASFCVGRTIEGVFAAYRKSGGLLSDGALAEELVSWAEEWLEKEGLALRRFMSYSWVPMLGQLSEPHRDRFVATILRTVTATSQFDSIFHGYLFPVMHVQQHMTPRMLVAFAAFRVGNHNDNSEWFAHYPHMHHLGSPDTLLALYKTRNFNVFCRGMRDALPNQGWRLRHVGPLFLVDGSDRPRPGKSTAVAAVVVWSTLRVHHADFVAAHWAVLAATPARALVRQFRAGDSLGSYTARFPYRLRPFIAASKWAREAATVLYLWKARTETAGDKALPDEILLLCLGACPYMNA